MKFKPDFKPHFLGGLAVLVASLVAATVLLFLVQLHPLTVAILAAGLAAAAAVEGTQANDNRLAKLTGLPEPHEVSLRDAWNSALACVVGAAAIELAARTGLLPPLG